jgi:uncharacterized protein (TIRG00374 family)
MKTAAKNTITVVFLLAGIVGLYYILRGFSLKSIFDTYKAFDPLTLLFYVITVIVLFGVLTWRWDVIMRSRGFKVPFRKLFVYRVIGNSINYLTPGPRVGGEPTQATLLTKHGIEFTEGLSTIFIDKMIDTTNSGLLFVLGAILVGLKYSFPRNTEITLAVGGIIFVTLLSIFYYRMLHNKHFFLHIFRFLMLDRTKIHWLNEFEHGIEKVERIMIEFYNHDRKAFRNSILISILSWGLMFGEYHFATTLLGLHLGIVEMFFIITFIGIAQLFPIPMAVGVLEAGQISAFTLIDLPANAGVALAFLVRIKDILWAIIGLALLATYGFHVPKVVEEKYRPKEGSSR